MKQFFFLINLLFFLIFTTGKTVAQDFQNPGTYMEYISAQHQTIAKRFLAYNSALSHSKKEKKIDERKSKLLDEIQESKINISSMPAFKTDKSYRDSAVSFMKL